MNSYQDISEIRERLLYIDKTDDKHFIKKIIELYNDGVDERTLQSIFWQRYEIEEWLTDKSLEGKDYTVLYKENEKGIFRSNTYKTEEIRRIWLSTIIYEDEDITINKPTTFEQANSIGLYIWCFCENESYWFQHCFPIDNGGNGETIFFIHDVMLNSPDNYIADMVKPNGKHEILNSKHHHINPTEFLQGIGTNATNVL